MQNSYSANPQEAYRRQNILTASPAELIIMLYDGLLKDVRLAIRAIGKNNAEATHRHLMKAQAIVAELINCLDLSFSIAADLMNLYDFLLHTLAEANAAKDAAMLEPLLEIIETLRDTWREAADLDKTAGHEAQMPQENLG